MAWQKMQVRNWYHCGLRWYNMRGWILYPAWPTANRARLARTSAKVPLYDGRFLPLRAPSTTSAAFPIA